MTTRRKVLTALASLTGFAFLAGLFRLISPKSEMKKGSEAMTKFPLDFQWPVQEPFIFCVHHHDFYPKGTGQFGPKPALLLGRELGQDFVEKDGFRMYHGKEVPGFPVHPHRGFETITIVRKGYVDHADSLGAAGRYGEGDVQWMTAGAGVQHSEMFPLLKTEESNTLELFQIWLNLPRKSKLAPAHFKMFWSEKIPHTTVDSEKVRVSVIAGSFEGVKALAPPPNSWASESANEVIILLMNFSQGGSVRLPKSPSQAKLSLYFFDGAGLIVNGETLALNTGANLPSDQITEISSPSGDAQILILQAKAIGEPIVQYGPFVMNSREEIEQTIQDYQRTEFGGWPWARQDMVHGPAIERFAKYPDGRIEKPTTQG